MRVPSSNEDQCSDESQWNEAGDVAQEIPQEPIGLHVPQPRKTKSFGVEWREDDGNLEVAQGAIRHSVHYRMPQSVAFGPKAREVIEGDEIPAIAQCREGTGSDEIVLCGDLCGIENRAGDRKPGEAAAPTRRTVAETTEQQATVERLLAANDGASPRVARRHTIHVDCSALSRSRRDGDKMRFSDVKARCVDLPMAEIRATGIAHANYEPALSLRNDQRGEAAVVFDGQYRSQPSSRFVVGFDHEVNAQGIARELFSAPDSSLSRRDPDGIELETWLSVQRFDTVARRKRKGREAQVHEPRYLNDQQQAQAQINRRAAKAFGRVGRHDAAA